MAAASQCDICGRTYPLYNTKKDAGNPNGFMFVNRDRDRKYWSHNITDCCPECMESIKAHVDMLKQRGMMVEGSETR